MLLSMFRWLAKHVRFMLWPALPFDKHEPMFWSADLLTDCIWRECVRFLSEADSQ